MIDLDAYPLPQRVIHGEKYIWDPIRRIKLRFRPEERIRQQFISFLIYDMQISKSLISVESMVRNPTQKTPVRADIIIHESKSLKPKTIVEIKAPGKALGFKTTTQIHRYENMLPVENWVTTNGEEWNVFSRKSDSFTRIDGILDNSRNDVYYMPKFNHTSWSRIVGSESYAKAPLAWHREKYQMGLAGDDEPGASLLGLQISSMLRDQALMQIILKKASKNAIARGFKFLELKSSELANEWQDHYFFYEHENHKFAIGTGFNIAGHASVKTLKKDTNGKYKHLDIPLNRFKFFPVDIQDIETEAGLILESILGRDF